MTTTQARYEAALARSTGEIVGTSCIPLTWEDVGDAVALAGTPGTLYIAEVTRRGLKPEPVVAAPGPLVESEVVVEVVEARLINAGADFLGVYEGPRGVVEACSRAKPVTEVWWEPRHLVRVG